MFSAFQVTDNSYQSCNYQQLLPLTFTLSVWEPATALNVGSIIGGSVGGVFFLALLFAAAVLFLLHLRAEQSWRIEFKDIRVREGRVYREY